MTTLAQLDMTLDDLNLGAIDAEADHNLADHFIVTSYATGLLDARRENILGRKGSGKSALFTQLATVVPNGIVVENIAPDATVWALLNKHQDPNNPNSEAAFVTAWSYILTLLAAQALVNADRELSEPTRRSFAPAHKFLQDNFKTGTGATAVTRSFIKRVRTLNLQAFGLGVGLEWEPDEVSEAATFIVEKVMTSIEPAIHEVGLVLALDKLDEIWDGSAEAKSIMVGLLRAAKHLNDKFGFRAAGQNHLRVITFIRSDIYDALSFDDKDKHRPLEHQIVWSHESLSEMVTKRLPDGVSVDDLFEGGMRGTTDPFKYIVSRTFMRPREVLQFLGEAKKDSGSHSTISGDSIRSGEARYSAWKLEDLKQEYSKSDPGLGTLLECLRQGIHRYDSVEELESLIQAKAPQLLDPPDITARTLVEKLFSYSVIGVRVGNAGSPRFKSETPQLTLPPAGAVYVHPSLHKGLLIKEARKSGSFT